VSRRLLSGVVNSQHTDAVSVCKLLQFSDNLVVAGIAVRFAAGLPNFLHSVDDHEFGVRMVPHKIGKLLVQTVADFSSRRCKMEIGRIVYPIHLEHPTLDALEVIFKGEVKNRSLMDFVLPQLFARTDMVSNLRHQKGLADFGSASKDIRPGVEQ